MLSASDLGGASEALGYLNSFLECPGNKSRGILYVDWQGGSIGSFSECDCYDDLIVPIPSTLFAAFAKRVAPGLVRLTGRAIAPALKKVAVGKLKPWLDFTRKEVDELTAQIASKNAAIDAINVDFIPVKNRWFSLKEEYNALFAQRKLIDDEMFLIVNKANLLSSRLKNAFGGSVPKRVRGRKMPDGKVEIGEFQPLKYFYDIPRFDFQPTTGQLTDEWLAEWQSMVDMLYDGIPQNVPEGRIKNYLEQKLGDLDDVTTDPDDLLGGGLNKLDADIAQKKLERKQKTDRMLDIRPQIEEDFQELRRMRDQFEVLDWEKMRLNSWKVEKQTELNFYQSELDQLQSAGNPEQIQLKIDQISESLKGLGSRAPDFSETVFSTIINVISTLAIKEKHQCANGAILDENECRCSICQEGKQLCDVETLFNKYALLTAQLPLSRMGDELNFCLDECPCGTQQVPRPFSGGSLSELLNWIGVASPCYCGCEDRKQNPADPDPVPYEMKICYKTECGQSTSSIGKLCDTKYPPDDVYGNMHNRYEDWQSKYFWSSNKEYCRWVETPCDDVIFGGVQYSGQFVPGRTSQGNGRCKYNVTCYDCAQCPTGTTFQLGRSEIEGKNCSDLPGQFVNSCDDCGLSSSSSSSCLEKCNGICCPEGHTCVAGVCCPPDMFCNGGCCPDGETCCGNTCCPDTVKGEKFICNGNKCVTESYFCQGTDIWTT